MQTAGFRKAGFMKAEKRKKWTKDPYDMHMFRIRGVSWWDREMPDVKEMDRGLSSLEKAGLKTDFMFTHCPPASTLAMLGSGCYGQDELTRYLEGVKQKVEYKAWFSGHMHMNRSVTHKDHILYEQIIRIA